MKLSRPNMVCCATGKKGDGVSDNQYPGVVVNQMYEIANGADEMSQKQTKQLSPADLLSFARQSAMGMEYLANNHVVHRDLAARNVLVCADRSIKISDFGMSRDVYERNVYHKKGSGMLPVKWMAPESLWNQEYTTKSDVWSFGILVWEIVTFGGNPYPGIPTEKLFEFLREGHRLDCPPNCIKELYNIMLACWEANPKRRPTFTELYKKLDDLLEASSPQEYLNVTKLQE